MCTELYTHNYFSKINRLQHHTPWLTSADYNLDYSDNTTSSTIDNTSTQLIADYKMYLKTTAYVMNIKSIESSGNRL